MIWPKLGVAARIMAGLATLTLITAAGGVVAVFSLNQFHESFDRVASSQLGTMAAAAQLEQESQALAGLAPELFVKGLGKGSLLAFNTQLYGQQTRLQQLIQKLRDYVGDAKSVALIETASENLFRNADELSTVIFDRAEAEDELNSAIGALGQVYGEAFSAAESLDGATEPEEGRTIAAWLSNAGQLSSLALQALSADTSDQLAAIAAGSSKRLQAAEPLAQSAARLLETLPELHDRLAEAMTGDRGIITLRERLLGIQREASRLLDANDSMSHELVVAVEALVGDIRTDIGEQNTTLGYVLSERSQMLTALGALGLLSALVIAAYFQLSVIRRLERLRHSMRNELSAESVTHLTAGHDEISEMARSFVHFVNEINGRDEQVRRSQQRLTNAIESISDGFSLYDTRDELVLSNARYRQLLYPGIEEYIQPGQTFESIVRKAVEHGLIENARGRPEEWMAERIEQHRNPKGASVQERGDGRWIEIKERKTDDGDTVAIYTDITERRKFEARLLEEKQRTDDANLRITEQNRMLESLSNQLSKYLSPQVYSSIFSGKQQVGIASKRKKLTIFFSDIAGFTETTDSLESEELTSLLNSYLTEMSRIALEHGATIDKYIGDAILIFFGDPESRGIREDAIACVKMAIAMQRRMQELQHEWSNLGLEKPFEIRMGINTGYCTVGNFGSEDRMDYTIIGNEVNLAERLQARASPGGILLAHETYSLARDIVTCEEQEPVQVKGFSKPIRNYSVQEIYQEQKPKDGIICKEREGFGIWIDLNKLGDASRDEIIRDIEQVVSSLRQE